MTTTHDSGTYRPPAPGRPDIRQRTLRTDRWWLPPLANALGLATFVVYATIRSLWGSAYYVEQYHYLSPFYSPCVSASCIPEASHLGQWFGEMPWFLPYALVSLPFLLGFRLTCYYYRKSYYRAFWSSPPACAVAEPHAKYSGETRFPLILQNAHRYFFYVAFAISILNTYDMVLAFQSTDPATGRDVVRAGAGHAHPADQRDRALALHAVVPLLPPHHRRTAQALLEAPGALQALDRALEAQHPPHAVRLADDRDADPGRLLRDARGERHHLRPADRELMTDPGTTTAFEAAGAPTTGEAPVTHYTYDVVVIGAGGAGLRAAIEARLRGKRVAIISKSLFGKAHTVMAEGGIAASMGNANPRDNWEVHFRDTMRGGKFLNNWRMAELHAKEAPQRVWELETYGALFDRTPEGKISQRNFGGHQFPRLAHVGDRTGLELIRTLQQKIVSLQQEDFARTGDYESDLAVYHEYTVTELLKDGDRIAGAFGYRRPTGELVCFHSAAVVLATGGVGKSFKVTSNSWEYTGDGHALAMRAGAKLLNMEFVQFHPTGMVWPPSVKGILVTESVRGDGGVLKNSEGERFMFNYIPEVFREQYATSEDEGDRWYTDADNNRRPPELLPRDEVARAINNEVKEGRGSPAGGVYLDVSSRMPAAEITRRLPSMYHQFKELADVDITAGPMEVGPTCHYVMGGVEVDPDTAASAVPGLFAAGEVAGGMHGSNRLGGNSLSDLLVFGCRAGAGAAAYLDGLGEVPSVSEQSITTAREDVERPIHNSGGENAYTVHQELQQTMNDLVGIIRKADEMELALKKLHELKDRIPRVAVDGRRAYNPGWHLALDLRNMLMVSECIAKAALERQESRGGHTRDDYPTMDENWRQELLVCSLRDDEVHLEHQGQPAMRHDLFDLFELDELKKYYTGDELGGHRSDAPPRQSRGTEDAGGDPGGELTGGGA